MKKWLIFIAILVALLAALYVLYSPCGGIGSSTWVRCETINSNILSNQEIEQFGHIIISDDIILLHSGQIQNTPFRVITNNTNEYCVAMISYCAVYPVTEESNHACPFVAFTPNAITQSNEGRDTFELKLDANTAQKGVYQVNLTAVVKDGLCDGSKPNSEETAVQAGWTTLARNKMIRVAIK